MLLNIQLSEEIYGVEYESGSYDDHIKTVIVIGTKEDCEALSEKLNKLVESCRMTKAMVEGDSNKAYKKTEKDLEKAMYTSREAWEDFNAEASHEYPNKYLNYASRELLRGALAEILGEYIYISESVDFRVVNMKMVKGFKCR